MATMNIALPDELQQFVDPQVAEHAYGPSSGYLRELIRKQRDIEQLRGVLLDGANSGPAVAADAGFFIAMREHADARAGEQ
ncbi:CopG family transcriptional regulator [Xanthomonas oryzae]|uniref:Antitoxin ParD n=1 Tax=Xanthomonas oryzae TaxID=347 RepID=A0AAP0ZNE9_9XANT|nr:type II toxin-antitoxin system ParD family antitoxin [Xanthomonas oryzae]KOR48002.1 CopG family transcriptional regulator [Xanthomonas oryzae]QBG84636.1 type II toxin-antitoxin system ParD family antitoxin [Xanthomonas oryzae]